MQTMSQIAQPWLKTSMSLLSRISLMNLNQRTESLHCICKAAAPHTSTLTYTITFVSTIFGLWHQSFP